MQASDTHHLIRVTRTSDKQVAIELERKTGNTPAESDEQWQRLERTVREAQRHFHRGVMAIEDAARFDDKINIDVHSDSVLYARQIALMDLARDLIDGVGYYVVGQVRHCDPDDGDGELQLCCEFRLV